SPSPPSRSSSPPPRLPSPIEPASPALSEALTLRIFPDTPPLTPDPPPRSYFFLQESDSFESLIRQFPRTTEPIPEGTYTIGPHYFDPQEIRRAIAAIPLHSEITVFIPNSAYPYLIPVEFFFNLFPPSSATIREL
ncbi:hypothetical protein ALC57_09943, partial [Trachymyrmex cornetzi]